MIDLTRIEEYRENNRIEAKKALGGLPRSIWETYSAFANAMGGLLLLGVEEHPDHSLHAVDLPHAEAMVEEFWTRINDPAQVSVNILRRRDVQILDAGGKHIIAIRVPKAQRQDLPVYIGPSPMSGTYRRNGEGDYRCPPDEVERMLKEAAEPSMDMRPLSHLGLDALDMACVARYRARMLAERPGHSWQELNEADFLIKLGAAARIDDVLHPTAAGLLLFGRYESIVSQFPHYLLTYREQGITLFTSADSSANLFDFYFQLRQCLDEIPYPPAVQASFREALANCLVNADYIAPGGILIDYRSGQIAFSNPGGFRISIETAKSGGRSDPRAPTLIRMFHLVSLAEGSGSGLPGIYAIWQKQDWPPPSITECSDLHRTTLSLPLAPLPAHAVPYSPARRPLARAVIIDYLTDHASATAQELADLLKLSTENIQIYLDELVSESILSLTPQLRYRLKH